MPVRFGSPESPEREWDFGDGAPRVTGREVRHAYARGGLYTVRALERGAEAGTVKLVAGPRRVTRATPPTASSLVYLPRMAGNVERAVDFGERALGAAAAQRALMDGVISDVLLEWVAAQSALEGPLDLDEGLGVFALPDAGSALCFGVVDGAKAISRLSERFAARGTSGRSEPDGSYRLQLGDGRRAALFEDRGYVYVSTQPAPEDDAPLDWQGEGRWAEVERLIQAVRAAPAEGMEGTALWRGVGKQLLPGNVQLLIPAPAGSAGTFRGVAAQVQLGSDEATLDGYLDADGPLWIAQGAVPAATLLQRRPAHPLAAAYLQAAPSELATLVVGGKASPMRKRFLERNQLQPEQLDAFLAALTGELSVLAYFDAEAFYWNLVNGNERPEPRGSLVVEVGVKDAQQVQPLLQRALAEAGLRAQPLDATPPVLRRWRARVLGQAVEVALTADRLTVSAGEPLAGREPVPLHAALSSRFGAGAFDPGRLSAMVDFGELIRQLEVPREIPGVDSERLVSVQAFSGTFFKGLTPLDFGYVEIIPLPRGGRIRAKVHLRGR